MMLMEQDKRRKQELTAGHQVVSLQVGLNPPGTTTTMGRVKVRHHVDPLHEEKAGSETDEYNDDYHIKEDGARKRLKPPKPVEPVK